MNIIKYKIIINLILISMLLSQCDNNNLADYNDDNILDILDVVVLVDQIMSEMQDIENSDINSDGIVNILDLVQIANFILDN